MKLAAQQLNNVVRDVVIDTSDVTLYCGFQFYQELDVLLCGNFDNHFMQYRLQLKSK